MPSIIDLLKKNKIAMYLVKYHLTNDQFERVYEIYTLINKMVNEEYNEEEKKEYITVSRNRILERILDDIVDSVKNSKDFMINDFTLDYLINNKNGHTLLQFSSNFHFLINQNSINRGNSYYSLEHFIEYIYNKSCNDKDYLERLSTDKNFYIIINDYPESYNKILELNNDKLLSMYNQLVGLLWYNELLDKEKIISKIGDYIYNNKEELLSRFDDVMLLVDDNRCDEYDNLLEEIIYNKVKVIDGDYDG